MDQHASNRGGSAVEMSDPALSAAQWHAVLEVVPGYLGVADRDRQLLSLNRPTPGRDLLHFVGHDFVEFVVADQRPMVIDAANRVLCGAGTVEVDILGAETGRWFRVRLVGIRDQGEVTGFLLHVLDVDDARSIELDRDMLRSRQRHAAAFDSGSADAGSAQRWLELIADALPVLISYVDRDLRYQYNNAAYSRWFGTDQEHMRGRTLQDVLGDSAFQLIRGYVDAVLEGHAVSFEQTIPYKDAGLRRVAAHFVPDIASDGEVIGYFALIEDVTARRTAEDDLRRREDEIRQLQKMEALGRLTGGIAHDFNNLLQSIIATSSVLLLRVGTVDAGFAHEVTRIKDVAQRGVSLTRQLLAFSRREELDSQLIDLDASLAELELLLVRLLESGIDFESDRRSSCHIEVDVGQIQQVMMNLIINARDAMPDGGKLRIETRRAELTPEHISRRVGVRPGSYAVVSVSDTGTGMDEATQKKIFEPFFTTKPPSKGTGLGLSMVYGVMQKLKGFIEVDSAPGQGTTFRLYFPCAPSDEEQE